MGILAQVLLEWYTKNARKLPWRENQDPYSIWISEIMLQQTRVDTVIPYYTKWMTRFPDIFHLAAATEEQVLAIWEGLGYYSRARNVHRTAQILNLKFDGKLPENIIDLIGLPGIGKYTAGAIASIAFNLDEPALDANIRRVFARVFNIDEDLGTTSGGKLIRSLIDDELPTGKAGDFNQSLMDLGATICISRNPRCKVCPLFELCRARKKGLQELRPVKKLKKIIPKYTYFAAIIKHEQKYLLCRKPSKGFLGGLWEFPNVRTSADLKDPFITLHELLMEKFSISAKAFKLQGIYKHSYTHFKQTMLAYYCEAESKFIENPNVKWVSNSNFKDYPMGRIARAISSSIKI